MKYRIDKDSDIPAYMQLYTQIKNDIVCGAYANGSKIPSKRLLAEESEVSVITVEHSYQILCEEGYIESRQRSGYFVIYKQDDFLVGIENPNHIEQNENTHIAKSDFPFTILSRTMRRVLLDYREKILVKSPNNGCFELRAAISSYLARSNGMKVLPCQVVIGSGAEYLYSLIAQLFSGYTFGVESPSYDKIRNVYSAAGISVDMLKMGQGGIKTSELERTEATILHITPFNSFPSGITANVSKRNEYIRWCEKRNGYIIEDNYASELTVSTKNEDTVYSLSKNDSVIYLNTFSQTIAPSMRVGYMILPLSLIQKFEEKLGFYSCTVPVFEQYVISELINSGDFERHINRIRRQRRKNQNK